MISGGLGLRRLEARISAPGQRVKSGRGSGSAESKPLDRQRQWPATRPWPVGFVEMNSHEETESSETSKVLVSRKMGTCE